MKVRIADSAGFCMGVRKAMDAVLEASLGKDATYTLGPLIHNPQAITMLEARNVFVADKVDDTLCGQTVVTRAHGITLPTAQRLEEVGARVIDATCPKVLRSQRIIGKYHEQGRTIVIVGDRGHAEVDSLVSQTGGEAVVVESRAEAEALPEMDTVCVVAQTTFNKEEYAAIAASIGKKSSDIYVAKTVCAATELRQADVRKLAQTTDATVVVGGRNSANTTRLAEISRELGQPTYHIEDPSELDLEALSAYSEIGVTAGASTPNWVIKEVVDSIAGYTPGSRRNPWGWVASAAFFAIEGNFVATAGAAALTYAMNLFMGITPDIFFALMAFFYLFPLHAVNKYLEINWKQIPSRARYARLHRYWRFYLVIAVLSFLVSLAIAWLLGVVPFILVAVSYAMGGLYSIRIIPTTWNLRYKSLRDIPGSKDIMTATAWTFAVIALPIIAHGEFPGLTVVLAGAAFVFVTVFTTAVIQAIGGIQSDKLVGIETIPALIGRRKTLQLLYSANIALAVVFAVLAAAGILVPEALIFLAPIAYMTACIRFLSTRGQFFTMYHQVILNADLFLAGILAFIAYTM